MYGVAAMFDTVLEDTDVWDLLVQFHVTLDKKLFNFFLFSFLDKVSKSHSSARTWSDGHFCFSKKIKDQ